MTNDFKNVKEELSNVDVLEFPKMKIDFTNNIDTIIVSSDVDGDELKINCQNTTLQTDTLKTDRIIIRGIDITDDLIELFIKNNHSI